MNAEQLKLIRPTNGLEHAEFVSNHHDTYPYITPTGNELARRSIFITGASKGIGRVTAIRCVKAGVAKIAIAARSPLDEVVRDLKAEAAKSNIPEPLILPLEVDVACKKSVETAAKLVDISFGNLDILVNNAGYLPDMTRIIDSDPNDWMKGWGVNIKGPYLCCHYLLPMILTSELRTIINLSSIGAHCISYGGSAYQNSRFALCRFTETLAREHEDEGLVAISLHPGAVRTDMSEKLPDFFQGMFADEVELPADTIVWLAKDRREWLSARFVSGNWDMKELEEKRNGIVDMDLFKFRLTL